MATYYDLPTEMKNLIIREPITVCRLINREMLYMKESVTIRKINHINYEIRDNYIKKAPISMIHKCDDRTIVYKDGVFLMEMKLRYDNYIEKLYKEPVFYWSSYQHSMLRECPESDLLAIYSILLEREPFQPNIAKDNVLNILNRKKLYKYAPNHKAYYYIWLYMNAVILNLRDLDKMKIYDIDFLEECTILHNDIVNYFNKL